MRFRLKAAFEETNSSDGTELGIVVARENATENAPAFFPPCPMDFKYFDSVVRSDDEAKYMAKWRKTDKKREMEEANAVQGVPAFYNFVQGFFHVGCVTNCEKAEIIAVIVSGGQRPFGRSERATVNGPSLRPSRGNYGRYFDERRRPLSGLYNFARKRLKGEIRN